jgi:hypothetical protein
VGCSNRSPCISMFFRYLYQHVSFDYCIITSFICSNIEYSFLYPIPSYFFRYPTASALDSYIQYHHLLVPVSCPVKFGSISSPPHLYVPVSFVMHLAVLISGSLVSFPPFLPPVLSFFCIRVPQLFVPVSRTRISLFMYLILSSSCYYIQTHTCF